MQETPVRFLGWEDPLEKGTATYSSVLAWRIPWTLQSTGSQRVGHDWVTFTFTLATCRHQNPFFFKKKKSLYGICYNNVSVLILFFAMWDLSSSLRVQTCTPCIGIWSRKHWTTRVVPQNPPLFIKSSEVYVPPYTVEWRFSFREWRRILCPAHCWHLLKADSCSSTQCNLGDPDTQVYPPGLWVTAVPVTLGPVLQLNVL